MIKGYIKILKKKNKSKNTFVGRKRERTKNRIKSRNKKKNGNEENE